MEAWLEWARGPAFLFSFGFMALGMIRHLLITLWEVIRSLGRASDRNIPYGQIARSTLSWLLPIRGLRSAPLFATTSILFHVAILVVPLFLAGHIALWKRGTGFGWPAVPQVAADWLTLLAVATGIGLTVQRVIAKATRTLSRFQDFALPVLICIPFVTGFLMMHPLLNPFSYSGTFLLHILSANLILILIPLTKLSHFVLFPGAQLVSELGWHWPSDAGSSVGVALGKENASI